LSIRQAGCKRLLAALESSQLRDDLVDDTRDIGVGSDGRDLGELALGLGDGGEAASRGADGGNVDVDELGKELDDLIDGGDDLLLIDSDGGALGGQSWELNWEVGEFGKVNVNVNELGEEADDAVDDLDDLGLVDADLALGGQGGDTSWELGELGKVDVDVDQLSQELDDRVDDGDDLGLIDGDLALDGELGDVDGKLWDLWDFDWKSRKVDGEVRDVQGALDWEFRDLRKIDWELGKLWDGDRELRETEIALDGEVKGKVNWEFRELNWELRKLWSWQARVWKVDGGGGREGNKAGEDSRVTHLKVLGWWGMYEEL